MSCAAHPFSDAFPLYNIERDVPLQEQFRRTSSVPAIVVLGDVVWAEFFLPFSDHIESKPCLSLKFCEEPFTELALWKPPVVCLPISSGLPSTRLLIRDMSKVGTQTANHKNKRIINRFQWNVATSHSSSGEKQYKRRTDMSNIPISWSAFVKTQWIPTIFHTCTKTTNLVVWRFASLSYQLMARIFVNKMLVRR